MLIELIIGQLFLASFNLSNVVYDAYRIMQNKTIAHAINFIAYLIVSIAICLLLRIKFHIYFLWDTIPIIHGPGLVFLVSALFNRQLSFDIPLNIRRGLKWYYQTKATGPKASLLDRLERRIFGSSEEVGKIIAAFYLGAYTATITSFIIAYG